MSLNPTSLDKAIDRFIYATAMCEKAEEFLRKARKSVREGKALLKQFDSECRAEAEKRGKG